MRVVNTVAPFFGPRSTSRVVTTRYSNEEAKYSKKVIQLRLIELKSHSPGICSNCGVRKTNHSHTHSRCPTHN